MHCRVFSRIYDLFLEDATPKPTPTVTITLVSVWPGVPCGCLWHFKVKPSHDIGPLGMENIPCLSKGTLHDLLAEVGPHSQHPHLSHFLILLFDIYLETVYEVPGYRDVNKISRVPAS